MATKYWQQYPIVIRASKPLNTNSKKVFRFSGLGLVTNILEYPKATAADTARPNAADFPLPLAAVNDTVDLKVFSEMPSTNFNNALAWSKKYLVYFPQELPAGCVMILATHIVDHLQPSIFCKMLVKMPRTIMSTKRDRKRKTWSSDQMTRAVEAVRTKSMGFTKAVESFGVPKTTLRRLVHNTELLPELVVQKPLGRAWLDHFLKRYKLQLSLRKPTGTSYARVQGFNPAAINKFFDILEAEYIKCQYPADRIYNVDETGITIVQTKIPAVVGRKGKRQIGALTAAERGSLITIVSAMSAGGTFIPPMMIFPKKNFSDVLMKGAPPGALGRVHSSGWIQTNLFTAWFEHFLEKTHPTENSPILLILDGHYLGPQQSMIM
ncbi:unnamed protein product [Acanthoscelides obtectus]|uniref:HTH psq-type domain-containing protein n=1 Tax=Acanthoscelides obtectus TaxID=200917 RepID=A0A9P0KE90_ACAOB|nr:unnamed protein product [Acanthoscelides obtectus]CAK1661663.1 hypothetical protein AOBTE_LOCUS22736 [Acanthoscelides obtectus]